MALVIFDVPAFMEAWKSIQDRMDGFGEIAWRNAVKDAWDAQREHGYQNKTGRLTASMGWRTWHSSRFDYSGELEATAPYALYVDTGTRRFRGAKFSHAAINRFDTSIKTKLAEAFAAAANK